MGDVFFFDGETPQHHFSFCAVLDVLGFRERMIQSFVDGTQDQLLGIFHRAWKARVEESKKEADDGGGFYFKSYTDNAVMAYVALTDDMEAEFGFIFNSIVRYQLELARHGFFLRGGVAEGPLFFDDICVFGKALLDAHDLESVVASKEQLPAVILSDEVASRVTEHQGFYNPEFGPAPQARLILRNPGKPYFINYLEACIWDDDVTILDSDALADHRQHLVKGLADYAGTEKVLDKFLWLAAYHNHFLSTVQNMTGFDAALMIPDVPPGLKFISPPVVLPDPLPPQ